MAHMTDHWKDLIVAEQSVLVNIFHCPQALFPPSTKAYQEAKQTLVKKYVHINGRCVSRFGEHLTNYFVSLPPFLLPLLTSVIPNVSFSCPPPKILIGHLSILQVLYLYADK